MLSGRRFRFLPVLTGCALIGLGVLVSLGVWQLKRLEWKRGLIAQVEAGVDAAPIAYAEAVARAEAGEAMDYAPVEIKGVYAHDHEVRVFGAHDGAPGVFVFTPLETSGAGAGEQFVFVNRGFAPQAFAPRESRADGEAPGNITVRGLFRSPEHLTGISRWVRGDAQAQGGLWLVRDPARFAAASGIAAPGYYIDSDGAENPAAWPRGGATRLEFSNRHLEYALTWFGLAGALIAVWLIFSLPVHTKSNNFKK